MLKRLLLLQMNRGWHLYAEFVHNALFVDLLRHGMPEVLALLTMVEGLISKHGTLLVILIALLLTRRRDNGNEQVLLPWKKERGGKLTMLPRDSRGRFVKPKKAQPRKIRRPRGKK